MQMWNGVWFVPNTCRTEVSVTFSKNISAVMDWMDVTSARYYDYKGEFDPWEYK